MAYRLGIDFGTTFTAAAVLEQGRHRVVSLGDKAPEVPSVAFLAPDGGLLFGEAAVRRGTEDPSRVAYEFKRRLGDRTALLLGGVPMPVESLLGHLLRWVVAEVARREGGLPTSTIVTHPANWGAFRKEMLGQALEQAGLDGAVLRDEPTAAAMHFASGTRIGVGDLIATYDLGGGTFDAALLRKTQIGFELVGTPQGIEHLGGADFDAAVLQHVIESLPSEMTQPETGELSVAALSRLRRECVDAKEALSHDIAVSIPVSFGGLETSVRMNRAELEDMIRPAVEETMASLLRTLHTADVSADDLTAVVLVGGSSRIPFVTELLEQRFRCPIESSLEPQHAVALGAALPAAGEPPAVRQSRTPATATDDHPPRVEPTVERSRGARPHPWVALTGAVAAGLAIGMTIVGPQASVTREYELSSIGTVSGLKASRTATASLGPWHTTVTPDTDQRVAFTSARLLLAGPAKLIVDGHTNKPHRLTPERRPYKTITGAVILGLYLFIFAYGEALFRGVRRRGAVRVMDVLALAVLGGVTGVALAGTGWGLLHRLPSLATVIVIVAAAGVTGACLGVWQRARADRTVPAERRPSLPRGVVE